MASSKKNFERQMQNGEIQVPASRSIEDLKAAVKADINANNANAVQVRRTAVQVVVEGSAAFMKYQGILESAEFSDQGKTQQVATWRQTYGAELDNHETVLMSYIDRVRALVLPVPPDFAPSSAVEATVINGICSDLDDYNPATAARVARDAIARKNLPLCKRLADKLGAFSDYKKPFVNSGLISDVLLELADALTTDDVIRSAGAAEWCEDAESDVNTLISGDNGLRNGDGYFDPVMITAGALPILFPDRVAPKLRANTRLAQADDFIRTL